ncbi:MAG: TonB-dependent receptor [Bacteroidota bacterium]
MKTIRLQTMIVLLMILFSTSDAFAQFTANGKIIDTQTQETLVGANVVVTGTTIGTTTDKNGQFVLQSDTGIDSIKISLVGYKTQTIKLECKNQVIELESSIVELRDVVVTATKTDQKAKDIPAAIYVIPLEDIEQTDSRNVEEVLRKIPGVFTEDKYNAEYNVVSFRGVGLHTHVTRGILVLVDGIPINEAMGRVDFEGIDMENAETIEVLKGPVSALYGPNGITGVINIVTKKAPEKFEGVIKSSIGSFDTRKIAGSAGGRIRKLGIRVNATHYLTDGYRDYNSYETNKAGAKLDLDLDKYGELLFSMNYINSMKDVTGPLDSAQYEERSTESTKDFAKGDIELMRFGLSHKKDFGKIFNLTTNLYLHNKNHEGGYSDDFITEDKMNLFGGEARLRSSFDLLARKNTLTIGINANKEEGDSKSYDLDSEGQKTGLTEEGTGIYEIIGCYIQNDYKILNSLSLTLGARYDIVNYDWQERFPNDTSDITSISALSPKVSLAYTGIKNLTLFGNVAKGFNPPQISDLFIGTTSNPELKPEYLINYEVGLRGRIFERLDYQLSFFLMDFTGQVLEDEITGKYENIGDTRHHGAESAVEIKLYKNLKFSINYAYLIAKFADSTDYFLRKTPVHQIGMGFNYTQPDGFTGGINLKWIDKYYMDNEEVNIYNGHCVVNAKLGYKLSRYFASFSINNLFDKNYATWSQASYRKGTWTESYYPGWPKNFIFTAGVEF